MEGCFAWLFDGIGSTILGLIISFVAGGVGGFALGRITKSKQIQKAGNGAKQEQSMIIDHGAKDENNRKQEKNSLKQKQIAGNNAEQTQTGRITHGK